MLVADVAHVVHRAVYASLKHLLSSGHPVRVCSRASVEASASGFQRHRQHIDSSPAVILHVL